MWAPRSAGCRGLAEVPPAALGLAYGRSLSPLCLPFTEVAGGPLVVHSTRIIITAMNITIY